MPQTAHRAIAAVMGQPWAIKPDALPGIIEIATRRNEEPAAVAAKLGKPLENTHKVMVRDGVAIVPVTGPLFPHANMMTELSGATSYAALARDIDEAAENPNVSSILLDIDSPGGVAFGPNELSEQIRAAAGMKPVVAYVSGMACSAAYWIASAATEIVADESAMLGSIGVVQALSVQEQAGSDGYRDYEIVSSNAENKRPDPRTDAGRAEIKREVDEIEAVFVAKVAAGRGVSVDTVLSDFGRGGCFIGAKAVAAGLADRLGGFEALVREMAAAGGEEMRADATGRALKRNEAATVGRRSTEEEGSMNLSELTAEQLTAERPDLADTVAKGAHEAGLKEGIAQGRAEGAEAERTRILGIEETAAMPGHEALIATLKADGKTTPEQAAAAVLAAERKSGGNLLKAMQADAAEQPAADPVPAKAAVVDENLPLADRCKAKWDKDPDLRAEFGDDFDRYAAFEKNLASGNVRILKQAG